MLIKIVVKKTSLLPKHIKALAKRIETLKIRTKIYNSAVFVHENTDIKKNTKYFSVKCIQAFKNHLEIS